MSKFTYHKSNCLLCKVLCVLTHLCHYLCNQDTAAPSLQNSLVLPLCPTPAPANTSLFSICIDLPFPEGPIHGSQRVQPLETGFLQCVRGSHVSLSVAACYPTAWMHHSLLCFHPLKDIWVVSSFGQF